MKTTVEFIDAVKVRYDLPSDYAAAGLIGLTRSQVSKYRKGKDYFGDETCARVAELLEEDPAYVMACVHAERASSDVVRRVWEKLAKKLERAGALALAVLAVILSTWTGGPDAGARAATPTQAVASAEGCVLC
ncbi:DUF3693 domain-containing protein [Schlegelella aquatica]|uniref:DUF3693 domain-containing protein n=1 Tax=Caldimonas aquatica TaxID=376175 RepID=UPI003751DD99